MCVVVIRAPLYKLREVRQDCVTVALLIES
ncbi:MAG: hypothetical protein FD165_214 [Gammaproteobacteria bacterium]|nr:MAG: hypothetical protein FD165_214 [Gammaproteobacteria bacterium]TND06792.1 MAG: putative ABC transport system permease protein [Gammaproteobacteria bacterium]